jgi:hypothetical protein
MEDAGPAELALTLPPGLPDGWVFDRDLYCPTCRYNLRMLHTPRCPECGTVFRWQGLLHIGCPRCGQSLEVVDADACPACGLALNWQRLLAEADPARLRQFEYARHPFRAAWRTWLAALRPRRFWRGLSLETPPDVRRLRWLRRTALGIGISGILATHALAPDGISYGWYWLVRCLSLVAFVLVLPVMTTISLPRFTPTLTRFRIRRDQLLRCTAYSLSGVVWIALILLLTGAAVAIVNALWPMRTTWVLNRRLWFQPDLACFTPLVGSVYSYVSSSQSHHLELAVGTVVLLLAFAWWWWFLYVGLRHYLRLDGRNTAALLLSTQIISLLVALLILLEWAMNTCEGRLVLQFLV